MASVLENTIAEYYEALAAKDEATLKRIAVAHQRTIDKVGLQLQSVISKIEKDAALGLDSGTYILQRQRLSSFITEANFFFEEFGNEVGLSLTSGQKSVVSLAEGFVEDSIIGSNGPFPTGVNFGRLPEGAINQFVGTLGDGSPVRSLTASFGAEASTTLNRILLESVASGTNPLVAAKAMSAAVPDIGLARANTIARTEMMRAYRGANQKVMKANKGLLKGWKWYSALDRRACPVCWSLHGQIFPVEETMATHPNCRCVQLPVTKSWKELGYDVPEPALSKGMSTPGSQLFEELEEADKQFILGKAGYTGYKNGLFKLEDFVQDTYSPDWGFGRTTRSISSMVGKTNTRSLSAGQVPKGVSVRPNKLDLPPAFDPLEPAKKFADDMLQAGKISDSDYLQIVDSIDSGLFTKAEQIEDAVNKAYDDAIQQMNDILDEAKSLDALSDTAIQGIENQLANNPTVSNLDHLKMLIKEDIQKKKDIVKKELDDAIEELATQINKAYDYGTPNSAIVDDIAQKVMDGKYTTKQEVVDAIKIVSKEVDLNDPYAKLLSKMDEAVNLNPSLSPQASGINIQSLTIQEAKDQWKVWDDLVQQNTPLNYNSVMNHPKINDLTKLLNDGKITQTEYQKLIQEGAQGFHTNKTFGEAIEQLENVAAKKVTKSSQQLLAELNQTGYPQHIKDDIANKYKTKQWNKEQLQQYIDSAPSPSVTSAPKGIAQAPSPVGGTWNNVSDALTDAYQAYHKSQITAKDYNAIKKVYNNIGYPNPWGKLVDEDYFFNYVEKKLGIKPNAGSVTKKGLPYKKHMVDLDNLLKSNAIDQNTYDDILLKFAQGKYKNKQVEQLINNFKVLGGQQGGSTYVAGSIDVKNFYWDYQGWMNGRGRAMNKLFNMTPNERDALREYTGSAYTQINRYLRKGPGSSYNQAYTKELIDNMDSFFNKSRLTEDVKIYRSFNVDKNNPFANPKVGDILVDKGYQSFTVRDGGLSGWGTTSDCNRSYVRIVAIARQGSKAAWVQPISQHSHEEEMLIPRDAKFVVTEVVETKNHTPGCGSRWTIYGEFPP